MVVFVVRPGLRDLSDLRRSTECTRLLGLDRAAAKVIQPPEAYRLRYDAHILQRMRTR